MNQENSNIYKNQEGEPISLFFEELIKRTLEIN